MLARRQSRSPRSIARLLALASAIVVGCASADSDAFWFICRMRDASKAADIAGAAKSRYYKLLADSNASQQDIDAAKAAWDLLRDQALGKIKEFARDVPNTSFTGPSDLRDLIRQAIREAIKEATGEIIAINRGGMPGTVPSGRNGEFARPPGDLVACPAFQQMPVGPLDTGDIQVTRLAYLTPSDYDGSEGQPPQDWAQTTPLIILEGTFAHVPFGQCFISAANPNSPAHGGLVVTGHTLADIFAADPTMAEAPFDAGFITGALIDWIDAQNFPWDPHDKIKRGELGAAGMLSVTVDNDDLEIVFCSGTFKCVVGPRALWENGSHDGRSALASEMNTMIPDARTADDCELATGNGLPYRIREIKATLLQDSAVQDAMLEIYADSGNGGPAAGPPLMTLPAAGSLITGTSFGVPVVQYTFKDDINDAGIVYFRNCAAGAHYWISPVGLGDGSHVDRAYFATAINTLDSQRGYFMSSDGFPAWTSVAHPDLLGMESEFSFSLDAVQLQPIPPGTVEVSFGDSLASILGCTTNFFPGVSPACSVQLPGPAAAQDVREAALTALTACGQTVTTGSETNKLSVHNLPVDGSFRVQTCGGLGSITLMGGAPLHARIEADGEFDPLNGADEMFFAVSIITEVGELSARVTAAELNFQTDGPIICQALFQRLAPRAPQYGAQITQTGSRLDIFFDPWNPDPVRPLPPPRGVRLNTNSRGRGPQPLGPEVLIDWDPRFLHCPADFNQDGFRDPDDLADFITCFFLQSQNPGACPAADFNGDGNSDPDDLADFITTFFTSTDC